MYYLARLVNGKYVEIDPFNYESKELAELDVNSFNMLLEMEKEKGEWKVVKITEA